MSKIFGGALKEISPTKAEAMFENCHATKLDKTPTLMLCSVVLLNVDGIVTDAILQDFSKMGVSFGYLLKRLLENPERVWPSTKGGRGFKRLCNALRRNAIDKSLYLSPFRKSPVIDHLLRLLPQFLVLK